MMKASSFLSVGVAVIQVSQGLLLHPYQTMQEMVRERVFWWLTMLPTALLGLLMLFWRVIGWPSFSAVGGCSAAGFGVCSVVKFAADWVSFFCAYWQLLLLYLFVRFWRIERHA